MHVLYAKFKISFCKKVRRDAKNLSSFLKSAPSNCIGLPLFIKSAEIFLFLVPQCYVLTMTLYVVKVICPLIGVHLLMV